MATIPEIPPLALCKDCRHMKPGDLPQEPLCMSPQRGTVRSLVTGLVTPALIFCTTHRTIKPDEARRTGACGIEGRFFEPKEDPKHG